MVGGGGAQGRGGGGGGRDARGVGGAARVLRHYAQGRKNSGGHSACHPRRVIFARTWLRTALPAVSRRKIHRGCADLEGRSGEAQGLLGRRIMLHKW
jgi:hypothetical protein